MADNIRAGLRIYCGNKPVLPPDRRRGSPFECFRRGFAVGRYVSEGTFPQRLQQRQRQVEAATRGLTRRQLVEQINKSQGIAFLKRELRLNQIQDKDIIRSIARRINLPQYWSKSVQTLRAELLERGFQP